MSNIFRGRPLWTACFVGHRVIPASDVFRVEAELIKVIREIMLSSDYVVFVVGRQGDFDQLAAHCVKTVQRELAGVTFSDLVLLEPYKKADLEWNEKNLLEIYDKVELCDASRWVHPRQAYEVRNRDMVENSELVIAYVGEKRGGAYTTLKYAEKLKRPIINLYI